MNMEACKVFVVDHRQARQKNEASLVEFIYPPKYDLHTQRKTVGRVGADFAELRALEESLQTNAYAGVFHYRRVLIIDEAKIEDVTIEKTWEGSFISAWNWAKTTELGWSKEKLEQYSQLGVTVLPNPVDVSHFGHENLYEQYVQAHGSKVLEAIEKKWPESNSFFEYLRSETKLIPFNIFLAPANVREKLFEWLLPILNSVEYDLSDLSQNDYQRRWPGFIAERLTSYFWFKNRDSLNLIYRPIGRLDKALEVDFFLPSEDTRAYLSVCDENSLLPTLLSIESFAEKSQSKSTFILLTTLLPEAYERYEDSFKWKFPHSSFYFIHYEKKVGPKAQYSHPQLSLESIGLSPLILEYDRVILLNPFTLCRKEIDQVFDFHVSKDVVIIKIVESLIKKKLSNFLSIYGIRLSFFSKIGYQSRGLKIARPKFPSEFLLLNLHDWRKECGHLVLLRRILNDQLKELSVEKSLSSYFKDKISVQTLKQVSIDLEQHYESKDVDKNPSVVFFAHLDLRDLSKLREVPFGIEFQQFIFRSILFPEVKTSFELTKFQVIFWRNISKVLNRSFFGKMRFHLKLPSFYKKFSYRIRKNRILLRVRNYITGA
jgi:hypothetical protein